MEGITILATNAINMEASILATTGILFGVFGVIIFLATAIQNLCRDNDLAFAGFCLVMAIICSGIGWISGRVVIRQTSVFSHYEYKVLIDDSVSLNEFNEKYEIIDQEGQIYTVIEREVD